MAYYIGKYLITIAALLALYIVLNDRFSDWREEELSRLPSDYKVALTVSVLIFFAAPYFFLGAPGGIITIVIFGREIYKSWKR